MTTEMELVVDAGGDVRCIYDEGLDLREIENPRSPGRATSSQMPKAAGGRIWGLLMGRFRGLPAVGRRCWNSRGRGWRRRGRCRTRSMVAGRRT
jgi:hypothetical protein